MSDQLWQNFESYKAKVDEYLKNYFIHKSSWKSQENHVPAILKLIESMGYSLLEGGKRFRPVVALLTGEILGVSDEEILPFAASLEMIHTYSLIHDDLPILDNDDERRGKPTNHRVFGEALALLAGDALQAEAFYSLSFGYQKNTQIVQRLTLLLSQSIGTLGMVGGQAMDILFSPSSLETEHSFAKKTLQDQIQLLHRLKTGALIAAATQGAGIIGQVSPEREKILFDFGHLLGFAFQLADDLLDRDEDHEQGRPSFLQIWGVKGTQQKLRQTVHQALGSLALFGGKTEQLIQLTLAVQRQVDFGFQKNEN